MIQAAVRGVVDFREADILDPRWWARTRIVLRQLDTNNTVQYLERLHHHNVSTLIVPRLEPEVFTQAVNQARQSLTGIRELLFPWDPKHTTEADTGKSLRDQWIAVYGDPTDPEVQRRIQATIDELRATTVRKT